MTAAVRRASTGAGLLVAAVMAAGCAAESESSAGQHGEHDDVQVAEQWLQLTDPHEEAGMTLLEGPVIGSDDRLYVTDVTAPPGEAKVFAVDREQDQVEEVYTDETSAITSAQFSPADGRLYLTDFAGGRILSVPEGGGEAEVVFSSDVEGTQMHPDDISFDEEGNLYITDSAGYGRPYWEASGRVVRIDAETESATVLAEDLPAPNGIAFTPDFNRLWVSHNAANQIDLLTLSGDGTEVDAGHPAISVDGGEAQVDSLAVDAEGHLYVGHHERPALLVFDEQGQLLQTIEAEQEDEGVELSSATNVAIEEGGTTAYMTVSGPSGGYVHTFEALGEGIQQSNGG